MLINGLELRILIGGKPITEYTLEKDGIQTFVEGRTSSEYEIQLRNTTYRRVEAVISVDGRSVVDGELAGAKSTGYLIEAYGTVKIPGFIVDGTTAAKFTFGAPKESYAAQMAGGDASNVGVIGVRVYSEKYKVVSTFVTKSYTPSLYDPLQQPWITGYPGTPLGPFSMSAVSSCIVGPTLNACSGQASLGGTSPEIEQQSLGTAFGDATAFRTTKVDFERDAEIATLVLYYDDRTGLKKRGINVEYQQAFGKPNPFPADVGCAPPPGWKR